MTKLRLYFTQLPSPSSPILKTFPRFRRNPIFESKVPKELKSC